MDASPRTTFSILGVFVCSVITVDLKWRSLSNFRQFVGTCSSALPFDPLSVCLGRAQEFASTAHCQPAWHHQIYFYSLQIEPLLYPYWHIPRLRGAWLHSRTSTGANLCPDCLQAWSAWSVCWLQDRSLASDVKETKTNIRGHILKCVHFLFKKKKKDIKYKLYFESFPFLRENNNSCVISSLVSWKAFWRINLKWKKKQQQTFTREQRDS